MKKLFFLFLLYGMPLLAQNSQIFEEANTAYNQGDYETAKNRYQEILEGGETSAEVYYNLANSHFKLDNLAPSIYYYEKALQLDPNDSDIRNNLNIARALVIDDVEGEEDSGFSGIWNSTVSVLGYNEWAWAAITFSVLFAVFFVVYYFNHKSVVKRTFFALSMVSIFLGFLSLIFAFQQHNIYNNNEYAIIFSQEAAVRNEPTLRSAESFYLHEGTKVRVLEEYQDWIKFELPNGIQGWMNESEVRFF